MRKNVNSFSPLTIIDLNYENNLYVYKQIMFCGSNVKYVIAVVLSNVSLNKYSVSFMLRILILSQSIIISNTRSREDNFEGKRGDVTYCSLIDLFLYFIFRALRASCLFYVFFVCFKKPF